MLSNFIYKALIFTVIGFLCINQGTSQVFPVQTSIQMIPPYSVSLNDYIMPGNNNLVIDLLLSDLQQSQVDIEISITITGPKVKLTTNHENLPAPITLYPGIPTRLAGSDLFDYLSPENLHCEGLNQTAFIQSNGKLPEGHYKFEVKVTEYQTARSLATVASTNAWLVLNDPPIINQPKQNEIVRASIPQSIYFHWMPRHMGSPNSIIGSTYQFQLYEVSPENTHPEQIVHATRPLFETETTNTFYIHGAGAYPLTPGQTYAVVIQVEAQNPSYDLFRNSGYSQIRTFKYGVACNPPKNINEQEISSNSAHFIWDDELSHTQYRIRLKTKNSETSNWHYRKSYFNDLKFNNLIQATEYEYEIQTVCGDICSDYSEIRSFTTLKKDSCDFICKSVEIELDDKQSAGILQSLSPYDLFTAADFEILVKEASRTNNLYSGKGSIIVPLFNDISIPVTFENIRISSSKQLTKGKIISQYNVNSAYLINQGQDHSKPHPGFVPSNSDSIINETYYRLENDTLFVSDKTDTLIFTDEIKSNLITSDGDTVPMKKTKNLVLAEASGESFSAHQNADSTTILDNQSSVRSTKNKVQGNQSIVDKIKFGSVTFFPDSTPVSSDTSKNIILYNNIIGTIKLELHSGKISKSFNLNKASVSYKKDTLSKYQDVYISWTGERDIGEIYVFSAKIINAKLSVDEAGNISGDLQLKPFLHDTVNFGLIRIHNNISGSILFSYNESVTFNGKFNFSGLKNVAFDVFKANRVIASIENVTFERDNPFIGSVNQDDGITYKNGPSKVTLSGLQMNFTFDIINKLCNLTSGRGKFSLSDVPGISGNINMSFSLENDNFIAFIRDENAKFSVFGMEVSKPSLTLSLDSALNLEYIDGSMMVKHPDFNNHLEVSNIFIENGYIQELSAIGEVSFNNIHLALNNSSYEDSLLRFNASVKHQSQNSDKKVIINGLTIDFNGNIKLEELSTDLVTYLGPVKIEFESINSIKKRKTEGLAKVYLNLEEPGFDKKEVILSKAYVKYKRKKDGTLKEGSIFWEGNLNVPEFPYFKAKVKKVNLTFEEIDGKEAVNGSINLSAYLHGDRKINDFIVLRKGLKGDFSFTYKGDKEDFTGKFNYLGINNINIEIVKSEKTLASLNNGSLNQEGILNGMLLTNEPVTYSSGGFDVTLENLSLSCSLNTLKPEFQINEGNGAVSIKNIKGIDGVIGLKLLYKGENFEALVQAENTELEAFSMQCSELNLISFFDSAFNFTGIEGSLSIKHDDFDVAFAVNDFELKDGELMKLTIEGETVYKGFKFDLRNAQYIDRSLLLSAKVAINASKTSSWFDVDHFRIDQNGGISVGKIKGDLNLSKMHIAFNATFNENAFKGSFDGDFLVLNFDGTLDIGSTNDFNYGYLGINAQTNIPFIPGFKITDLGGKIGYNYHLDFSDPLKPSGNPLKDNYVAGFKLGVGDNANLFALAAEPTVQFGNEAFEFNFNGSLDMPRRKPVFKGLVNVNYKSVDNSLSGSFGIGCKIPSTSGRIIKTDNVNLKFYHNDTKFTLEGTNMSATVLSLLTFKGNISYERINDEVTGEAISKSGEINGSITYGYDLDFDYEWTLAEISGGLDVDLGATMSAKFDNNGSEGSFGGFIDVLGELELHVLGDKFVWEVEAEAHAKADITYTNNYFDLDAEASFSFKTNRKTYEAECNFYKKWDLNQSNMVAIN